jgi:hypothetical protein
MDIKKTLAGWGEATLGLIAFLPLGIVSCTPVDSSPGFGFELSGKLVKDGLHRFVDGFNAGLPRLPDPPVETGVKVKG